MEFTWKNNGKIKLCIGPADNRGLNYDKFFKEGDETRNTLTEFNSNNTKLLNVEETKAKIASLAYIQERLAEKK